MGGGAAAGTVISPLPRHKTPAPGHWKAPALDQSRCTAMAPAAPANSNTSVIYTSRKSHTGATSTGTGWNVLTAGRCRAERPCSTHQRHCNVKSRTSSLPRRCGCHRGLHHIVVIPEQARAQSTARSNASTREPEPCRLQPFRNAHAVAAGEATYLPVNLPHIAQLQRPGYVIMSSMHALRLRGSGLLA